MAERDAHAVTPCAIPDKPVLVSAIVEDFDMHQRGGAVDRRIRKTRASLHEALAALIREKPYDDIAVKEILDRANVGRSTFYTHFRDKDELLLSAIHEILGSAPTRDGRVASEPIDRMLWFSLPVLEHVDRHRRPGDPIMEPAGKSALHERLQHAVAALVERELGPVRLRRGDAGDAPPDLLVSWIASTFVLVLDWWAKSDGLSARDADQVFRGLVRPALAAIYRSGSS